MQQFLNLWDNLDARRRVIVIGVTAIVFIGVLSLSRMAAQPGMSLLYSGLSPSAAGEVIAALDAQAANYDVRGGAIFVEDTARDRLRLTLAGDGLPSNGGDGYELLDNLTGFGTTSQMFDAAYLRAQEGELARTILANPTIKAARVHIAQTDNGPFRSSITPTASVSLRAGGSQISSEMATAIRFLVASAVAGLQPKDVSIINADLGVVIGQSETETPINAALNRAALLKKNVARLIEARTGAGNAIVEINVETLTEEEMIVERRFDPENRVAISTETQEISNSSTNQRNGGVTVASNLPDGDGGAGDNQSSTQNSDTREIVNYEVSETTREIRRIPGAVKRITVAVLVDGTQRIDDTGAEIWEARPAEELSALEDLIKSAVGFDEARGDSVTIRSMDLEQGIAPNNLDGPGWMTSQPFDVMGAARVAITALVVLALGLFVLRPVLLAASQSGPPLLAGTSGAASDGLSGEIDLGPDFISGPVEMANIDDGGFPQMQTMDISENFSENFDDDPIARLKALIEERQDETVEVLKSWIEAPEESA